MNSDKSGKIEQGVSLSKPPLLKTGQYEWWIQKMQKWITAEDPLCWHIILHGDMKVPQLVLRRKKPTDPEPPPRDKNYSQYDKDDLAIMARNAKTNLLLTNALTVEDTQKIAGFPTAKEKWKALKEMNEARHP